MLSLPTIQRALDAHEPELVEVAPRRAAVAMVLHQPDSGAGVEVLLIERARREGDPWSGQMAFPGGRKDESDPDLRHTAIRETREEVGLVLEGAPVLGRLDDQSGSRAGRSETLVISGFVFEVEHRSPTTPNDEVESAFWVPLSDLLDPALRIEYRHPPHPEIVFPAVVVGDPDRHVVWGLTLRFLERFFELVAPEGGAPL